VFSMNLGIQHDKTFIDINFTTTLMNIEARQKREELCSTLQQQHTTAWNEYHMLVQDLKQHIPSDKQDEVMTIVKRMCDAHGKVMVANHRYEETMKS